MASKDKSFEELVKEAPAAPAAGTVSLVGTLAQSGEAGKFVLTLQDGSALTLETAAVKGHEVLGTSVGHTIVRVDVEAEKIPPTTPTRVPEIWKPHTDPGTGPYDKYPFEDPRFAPFAMATPQQAPLSTLAALQGGSPYAVASGWWDALTGPIDVLKPLWDAPGTGLADLPV